VIGIPSELCFRNAVGDDRRGGPTSATDASRGRTLIDGGFDAAGSRCIEIRSADLDLGVARAELVRPLHLGCRSVSPLALTPHPRAGEGRPPIAWASRHFRSIARESLAMQCALGSSSLVGRHRRAPRSESGRTCRYMRVMAPRSLRVLPILSCPIAQSLDGILGAFFEAFLPHPSARFAWKHIRSVDGPLVARTYRQLYRRLPRRVAC
jgi:hypothetical protein